MIKVATILLALLTAGTSLWAKDKETITITPINQEADAINGNIIYSLPKTMLRIKVEAEVTIRKAGPYYRYSNKFLNLDNVITEDSKTWHIKHVSIESYGTPDKNRTYIISGTQLPAIKLTNNGILEGINISTPTKHKKHTHTNQNNNTIPELTFDNVRLGRNVLTKTSTAAMAEEAALSIYRLRDKRISLLGGEDATILNDEGSYNKVFAEIDRMEQEYLSLFTGKEEKIIITKYFNIEPGATSLTSTVLFRFSESDGFMDAMDITGQPVYIDLDFSAASKINTYSADSKQRKQNPLTGLRYIIPGIINVKIIDRNVLLTEADIPCSQNGQEATLPISLLDGSHSIKLNTINGSLIEIGNISETYRNSTKK